MRCHRPGELCYTVLTRERRVAELEASGMEADWWFCGHCQYTGMVVRVCERCETEESL